MKKIDLLQIQNEVLKKQIEYLLLRRKQQKSLSKLEQDYVGRKAQALVDETFLEEERIRNYFILCSMESEVRMRVVKNHIKQIDKFRKANIDFWNSILDMKF